MKSNPIQRWFWAMVFVLLIVAAADRLLRLLG